MTQSELAEQVGVRFQQIQKYESAANRIRQPVSEDCKDSRREGGCAVRGA